MVQGQTRLSALKLTAIGAVLALQWVVLVVPAFATATTTPLRITEIYPDAPNPESGKEYIEITNNTSAAIDLSLYQLQIKDQTTKKMQLSGSLSPSEHRAFVTPFTLLNSGDTVQLIHLAQSGEYVVLEEVSYTVTDGENWSWSYFPEGWEQTVPTPGLLNQRFVEEIEEPEPSEPPVCEVVITEVSAQANLAGKEYIEFFQPAQDDAALQSCSIQINGKSTKLLPEVTVSSGSYYVWELANGSISNSGGVITLQQSTGRVITYAYNKTLAGQVSNYESEGTTEVISAVPTPGMPNQYDTHAAKKSVTVEAVALADCGAGRYRHPETNRCRNIETAASTLIPCAADQVRNPETNRCRKATTATTASTLVPCKEGQERNPDTNRCRKIAATDNALKPCAVGQERNPETNRCRKIAGSQDLSSSLEEGIAQVSQPFPYKTPLIGMLSAAVVGYGGYEYRADIRRFFSHFRSTRQKFKPPS